MTGLEVQTTRAQWHRLNEAGRWTHSYSTRGLEHLGVFCVNRANNNRADSNHLGSRHISLDAPRAGLGGARATEHPHATLAEGGGLARYRL